MPGTKIKTMVYPSPGDMVEVVIICVPPAKVVVVAPSITITMPAGIIHIQSVSIAVINMGTITPRSCKISGDGGSFSTGTRPYHQ
jgi:hypothetical protein